MLTNPIYPCVNQQLQRPSNLSFFHSALLRFWQPFSVILLSSNYKHSYREISIAGAATFLARVVHSRYLRYCYGLIYYLITEAEVIQSADVGSAEGNAPLPSDVVFL